MKEWGNQWMDGVVVGVKAGSIVWGVAVGAGVKDGKGKTSIVGEFWI